MKILRFNEVRNYPPISVSSVGYKTSWRAPSVEKIKSIEEDLMNIIQPLLDGGYLKTKGHNIFGQNGTFNILLEIPTSNYILDEMSIDLDRKEQYDDYFEIIEKYSAILYGNINEITDRIKDMVDAKIIRIISLTVRSKRLSLQINGVIL